MRDNRQRQKRELQQGAGKRAAHRANRVHQGGDRRADHFGRRAAHQTGNRQGEFGYNQPVADRYKAAGQLDDAVQQLRLVPIAAVKGAGGPREPSYGGSDQKR